MVIGFTRCEYVRQRVAALCVAIAVVFSSLFAWEDVSAQTPDQKAGGLNNSVAGVAGREAARRGELLQKAQLALQEGEQLRADEDYAGAIEKYKLALNLLPNAPATREMRETVFSRYQSASIALAKQQIEEARYEDAEATLTAVVKDARDFGFGPGVISAELQTLIARVKSADYYNKALSPEHLAKVGQVEDFLQLANGHMMIGNYDEAETAYGQALSLDPYNEAGRRGMEKLERLRMKYYDAARSSTRATQLSAVAGGWELPVPPAAGFEPMEDRELSLTGSDEVVRIREKLDRIIIPSVEFANTPLSAVIEFLVQRSIELDVEETDPIKKGVNIVVDPSSGVDARNEALTLRLSNVPLRVVLEYALQQVNLEYRVDPVAVTVVGLGAAEEGIITKSFIVPPDFLRSGAGDGGGPADPFAADPFGGGGQAPTVGSIVKRQSAEDYLKARNISFPEGTSASFLPQSSTLVIRNTPSNVALVEAIVQASKAAGSKNVLITSRLISISEEGLKEIGFDTLLGQANIGGERVFSSGGVPGNTAGNRSPNDYPLLLPGGDAIGQFPVSAGLRSGQSPGGLSVDDVIARENPTVGIASEGAAPAIFGVAGAFTDPNFQIVLRGINQHRSVDRLTSGSVTTVPGQRAVIRQIREFIYPTEYDPPEIPNVISSNVTSIFTDVFGRTEVLPEAGSAAVTPATPTSFEMRELGVVIEVEPIVGPDNLTIDLNITTDISDFDGFINYGSPITNTIDNGFSFDTTGVGPLVISNPRGPQYTVTENRILQPVFSAIRNTTNVSVYDGQTVALGGLIQEDIANTEDKVPFLGDLPGIGALFKNKQRTGRKKALMLFVTVKILDGADQPLNGVAAN